MAQLVDFQTRTAAWLQDKVGRVPADNLTTYIQDAVKQYSGDRPYELVADVAGTGTHDLVLPTGFVDGFSELRSVEFPVDAVPETLLDSNSYRLYRKPTGPVIRLDDYTPTAAETARITYTGYHTTGTDGAAASTIPDVDLSAVCALAASYAAAQMANSYAQSVDLSVDAAFVDGQSRGDNERKAASELRAIYERRLRIQSDTQGAQAAGAGQAFVDLDPRFLGVTENVTHPRRWS